MRLTRHRCSPGIPSMGLRKPSYKKIIWCFTVSQSVQNYNQKKVENW